jgi:hypothetical protein
MLKALSSVLLAALICAPLFADPPAQLWSLSVHHGEYAEFLAVCTAANGDAVMGGCYRDTNDGNLTIAVRVSATPPYSAHWNVSVPASLEGEGGYTCQGVAPSRDGGFVFCADGTDWLWVPMVFKLAANGDTVWTRHFPQWSEGSLFGIAATTDQGYVVVGSHLLDAFAFKLDSTGNLDSQCGFDGPDYTTATAVVALPDGGFAVAGEWGLTQSFLARFDAPFSMRWNHIYDSSPYEGRLVSLDTTADGGFILAGIRNSTDSGYLTRTDSAGNPLWQREVQSGLSDCQFWRHSVKTLQDGTFLVAASLLTDSTTVTSGFLAGIAGNGDTLWTIFQVGLPVPIYYHALSLTSDGGFYVAGDQGDDALIERYAFPAAKGTSPVAATPARYDLSAYPNPFNPVTTLSLALPQAGPVTVDLYDVNGRLVRQLLHGTLAAGVQQITLDGSALPSGIYFVRLQAPAFTRTQKLVLMK